MWAQFWLPVLRCLHDPWIPGQDVSSSSTEAACVSQGVIDYKDKDEPT